MILYSEHPVDIMMKNIMLLDDDSTGGVVYVNKATYDEAIILKSRFDGNGGAILKFVIPDKCKPECKDAAIRFMKTATPVLRPVGPMLTLLSSNDGIDWENATIVDMYGYLHMMSQMVDFNAIAAVPKEVRAKVDIPTSLIKGYQESWNALTQTLKDIMVVPEGMVLISKEELDKRLAMPVLHSYVPEDDEDEDKEYVRERVPKKKKKAKKVVEVEDEDEDEDEKDDSSEPGFEANGDDISVDDDFFASMFASTQTMAEEATKKAKEETASLAGAGSDDKKDVPAPPMGGSGAYGTDAPKAPEAEKSAVNDLLNMYAGI